MLGKVLLTVLLLIFSLDSAFSQVVPPTQCIASAAATGTGDLITIPALPCGLTTNLLILNSVAANSTTTPTLQPLGLAAQLIVRPDGSSLQPGDISGANYKALLTPTGSKWFLLNPNAFIPPVPFLVNVVNFGADRTGVVDSCTALTNALAAIPTTGGSFYWPSGVYKLGCNIPFTNTNINMFGDGSGTTVLSFTNASSGQAGVKVSQNSHRFGTSVHNLSLQTTVNQVNGNAGLSVTYTDTQALNAIESVWDLDISSGPANANYWADGFDCSGCAYLDAHGVNIRGKNEGSPPTGISTSNMLNGIKGSGLSEEMNFQQVAVTFSQRGYYGSGNAEAPRFTGATMLAVNICWLDDDFVGSGDSSVGSEAGPRITQSHCAAYSNGAIIKGWRWTFIGDNTFFFKRSESTLAYTDVAFQDGVYPGPTTFGSKSGQVHGAVFEGSDNLNPGSSIGVSFSANSGFNQVDNNRFNAYFHVVDLGTSSQGNIINNNTASTITATGSWFTNISPSTIAYNNYPINAGGTDTGLVTLTVNSTTPSIGGAVTVNYTTANTMATSITDFTNSYVGQQITVIAGDNNTTIVNGATIALAGGVNFSPAAGHSLTLRRETASYWRESGRT